MVLKREPQTLFSQWRDIRRVPRVSRLRHGLQALCLSTEVVLRRGRRALRLGIAAMLRRGLRPLRLGFARVVLISRASEA